MQQGAIEQLAEYWYRAEAMRDLVHELMDADTNPWEIRMSLSYWLSGLFVVKEGFNKLRLRDSRVQKLFKEQLGYLKRVRDETYHFSFNNIQPQEMIEHVNWAEELHAAIGNYIRERILRKAHAERILELRAAKLSHKK